MAQPRFQLSRAHRFQKYTAGTITLGTTTGAFTAVPTLSQFTVEAQVGDVLEYAVSICWHGGAAVEVSLDAATFVSSAIVNHFGVGGATGYGTPGWTSQPTATYERTAGSSFYTVQAGDLSAGKVTAGLVYRPQTAVARQIQVSADVAFIHALKNLGPADPE